METQEEFDFESFKKEAISGLYSGKKMSGGDGVLAPLLKHLLESMLVGDWTIIWPRVRPLVNLTAKMVKPAKPFVV